MFILLWIVLAIFVGVYASNKKVGYGFFGGLFASLVFSPLIGFIAVALSKPNEEKLIRNGMKKCPHCAELVKREAIKCRFCGTEF